MTLIDQCRKFLRYEPETGRFYHQNNRRTDCNGKRAGYVTTKGYRQIRVCGIAHMEHRLAWLMTYGELPSDQIDHRNEIEGDNRIDNLRDVTQGVNLGRGSKPHKKNESTGVRGVYPMARSKGRFIAMIRIDTKLMKLGGFPSIDTARDAYEAARVKYGRT